MLDNIKALGIIFIALLALFGIGCWVGYTACNNKEKITVKVDTVDKIVYKDKIILKDIPAKTEYRTVKEYVTLYDTIHRNDTVYYLTQPFTDCLDTIIQHDTIQVCSKFPEHTFDIIIKPRPDTIRTVTITIDKVVKKNDWYELVGSACAGALIMFVVNK